MAQLPDELFREGAAEPEDSSGRSSRGAREGTPAELSGSRISLRATVLLLLVSLTAAFLLGRFVVFSGQPAQPFGSQTQPTMPIDPDAYRAYDGEVSELSAKDASSSCGENAPALLDYDRDTIWTCYGAGGDVRVRFDFLSSVELAGVRLINGNAADMDTFLRERRITKLTWQFSGGQYFEQALAPNSLSAQEVRFPRLIASWVELRVRDTTDPGDSEFESDAISLTQVEFLAPAG